MFHENDVVKLRRDQPSESAAAWPGVPASALAAGTVGTVVMVYDDGTAYEVEFVSPDGSTLGLLTLPPSELDPAQ